MRILIVSDAWQPQINGVVRTLESTIQQLKIMGHQVEVIGPDNTSWRSISAPSYPSIKLELFPGQRIRRTIQSFQPECIHIATEGPLGWSARNLCLHFKKPFTTSYHTRFPEYIAARVPSPISNLAKIIAYAGLRRFHAPSSAVMVATASIERELQQKKFRHIVRWSRGVDTNLFQPYDKDIPAYRDLPRPILLYVGRVAVEKNIEAFLNADRIGSKVVIGNGPDFEHLNRKYPAAHFLGSMEGENLARHYAAADLFVFPSTTDTFGLVLLEAAASGLRIASVPAPGPVDIFTDPTTQKFVALNSNMTEAIRSALALSDHPTLPCHFAKSFSWQACSEQFFQHLQSPTPQAVKRITRVRNWLSRSWQRALALRMK